MRSEIFVGYAAKPFRESDERGHVAMEFRIEDYAPRRISLRVVEGGPYLLGGVPVRGEGDGRAAVEDGRYEVFKGTVVGAEWSIVAVLFLYGAFFVVLAVVEHAALAIGEREAALFLEDGVEGFGLCALDFARDGRGRASVSHELTEEFVGGVLVVARPCATADGDASGAVVGSDNNGSLAVMLSEIERNFAGSVEGEEFFSHGCGVIGVGSPVHFATFDHKDKPFRVSR